MASNFDLDVRLLLSDNEAANFDDFIDQSDTFHGTEVPICSEFDLHAAIQPGHPVGIPGSQGRSQNGH